MVQKRVIIFIDGQNLFHAARDQGEDGVEIGMKNLVEELKGDDELVRSYWFDSHREDMNEGKERFFTFLKTNGFRVESLPLREYDDGLEEKGSDINLVSEMLHLGYIDAYDRAVLVSGDEDFVPAIKRVQDQGKIVDVASFDEQLSYELKKSADDTVILDDILSIILRDADSDDKPDDAGDNLFLQIEDDE